MWLIYKIYIIFSILIWVIIRIVAQLILLLLHYGGGDMFQQGVMILFYELYDGPNVNFKVLWLHFTDAVEGERNRGERKGKECHQTFLSVCLMARKQMEISENSQYALPFCEVFHLKLRISNMQVGRILNLLSFHLQWDN